MSAIEQLDALVARADWSDCRNPPSAESIAWAREAIVVLDGLPLRVVADVEGGIAIYLFVGDRRVWVSVDNDGSRWVLFRPVDAAETPTIDDLRAMVPKIRAHVGES